MIKVELWLAFVAKNQRLFIAKKIFSLMHIIRKAYIISITAMLI